MHLSVKVLLLVVIVAAINGCSEGPSWRLHDGKEQSLSALKGQWVLMNYWAEWCAPCIKEIPELNQLDEEAGITVLAYNFDRLQGEALSVQARRLGIRMRMMLDEPAPLFEQPRPSGLPATLVINPQGEVQQWLLGPQTQASIKAALNI